MSALSRRTAPRRWRRLLVETLEDRRVLAAALLAGLEELAIDRSDYHPSRLLIGLRPGANSQQFVGVMGQKGYSGSPLIGQGWELNLPVGTSVDSALEALRNNPL